MHLQMVNVLRSMQYVTFDSGHNTMIPQVVIDRGSSPGAVLLSVFTDGTFLTTIEVRTYDGRAVRDG